MEKSDTKTQNTSYVRGLILQVYVSIWLYWSKPLKSREVHFGRKKGQRMDTCDLPGPEPAVAEANGNFSQHSIKSGLD